MQQTQHTHLIRYPIRWDNSLRGYLITVFIGTSNQKVSMMLDTSLTALLFPSNCCLNPACLYQYGVYFFDQSPSCEVIKTNGAIEPCYNYQCGTIGYTLYPQEQRLESHFGILKKALVYDFIGFHRIDQTQTTQRYPLALITDVLLEKMPYIPPTLGLGPNNVLGFDKYTLDFVNYYIAFGLELNPRYRLIRSNLYPFGSKIVVAGGLIDCQFDMGYPYLSLPTNIYLMIKNQIVKNSNIDYHSQIWTNTIQIKRNETLIAPDIMFQFPTQDGANWNLILKMDDYIGWYGDYQYGMLIEENQEGKMIVGNCGLFRQKVGFSLTDGIWIY